MRDLFWKSSLVVSTLLGLPLVSAQPSPADQATLSQIKAYSDRTDEMVSVGEPDNGMSQLTSISQLTDVKPTDWAFQALKSLVERYGCIVGYPDQTYRGDRALTRWEFAAGLNACLDKVQELIAAATSDFVKKADLETIKRLQEDFAAELAALRGRVDALEVRTATLEKQQFSTTMKLSGSAIFALSDAFVSGLDNEAILQYRARILLKGSFNGRDALLMGFYAGNATGDGFDTGGFNPAFSPATRGRGRLARLVGSIRSTD